MYRVRITRYVQLAMPTPDGPPFVADGQPPTTTQPTTLQHVATVLGVHAMQKAMFTTTWDAFWLPCSLRHC
jgi:hypothetical protein